MVVKTGASSVFQMRLELEGYQFQSPLVIGQSNGARSRTAKGIRIYFIV